MRKKIIIFLALIILVLGYWGFRAIIRPALPAETRSLDETIPTFTEVVLDFEHLYDKGSYAFIGSALIDVDGDGVSEVWLGGGEGQVDGLFKFVDGNFVNITAESGLVNQTVAGGGLSLDVDNDGDVDLYVARLDGIYFYENQNGKFIERKLGIVFEKDAVPLSIATGDINKDGLPDLYISTFKSPKVFTTATFNNPANLSNNIMLLNKGDNLFEDITRKAGLTFNQNTFQVAFVDLNGDNWPDLVLAPNTDRVVVYENKRDGTFDRKSPLTDYGFWMGLGIADVDNDGDQDLMFSNVGNSIPRTALRGDLTVDQILDNEWALLRNDGDFQFTNIIAETGLAGYEFGWGAMFGDLNLDGHEDLSVVENYIKWPPHKINKLTGRVFLQSVAGQFEPITQIAGLENPYYGTSPLFSDFNGDGYLDVVFANFSGPSKAYLNNGGGNNFIKVSFPDKSASLGAVVEVEMADGYKLTKTIIGGLGLLSDPDTELIFGLGAANEAKKINITWSNGQTKEFNAVPAGTDIEVK